MLTLDDFLTLNLWNSSAMKITKRRLLILVAFLLIIFGVISPWLSGVSHGNAAGPLLAKLLISPPLLALLMVVIDEAGPLRNWAVTFLLLLVLPALVAYHDVTAAFQLVAHGIWPNLWGTLLLNAILLPPVLIFGRRMVPKPCPGCRRPALIPLTQLVKKEKRSANTFWCARCGGKYWKDQQGHWRLERRKTWFDRTKEPSTVRRMKPASPKAARPPTAATGATSDRRPAPWAAHEIDPS
jgi:hypothetical protein